MNIVRFGGPLGAMPGMGITLHPRCQGEASLPDDARAELVQAAPNCLLKHVQEQVARWHATSHKAAGQMTVEVSAAVAAAVSAELGLNVRMGSFSVDLSDEDRAALQARAKDHRMAVIAKQNAQETALAGAPTAPSAGAPTAPTAGVVSPPVKKKSGALFAILGGALVVVVAAAGLVWHFTHSPGTPPAAAHEHAHGKR
jgi:hypothetical protein